MSHDGLEKHDEEKVEEIRRRFNRCETIYETGLSHSDAEFLLQHIRNLDRLLVVQAKTIGENARRLDKIRKAANGDEWEWKGTKWTD